MPQARPSSHAMTEKTVAWAKIDFDFTGRGPAGYDRADADDFDFEEIKVSKGKYFGQKTATQSLAGLLAQSLKWGTHEWEVDVWVTGPNMDLSWTTDTWKKDLPEAQETTISYATEIFYLSMPGTYEVTVKLIPVGAYAYDTAGKVMATGTGTFTILAAWAPTGVE